MVIQHQYFINISLMGRIVKNVMKVLEKQNQKNHAKQNQNKRAFILKQLLL